MCVGLGGRVLTATGAHASKHYICVLDNISWQNGNSCVTASKKTHADFRRVVKPNLWSLDATFSELKILKLCGIVYFFTFLQELATNRRECLEIVHNLSDFIYVLSKNCNFLFNFCCIFSKASRSHLENRNQQRE